jgi:hypothetical protein
MFSVTRTWRVVLVGTGLAVLLAGSSPSAADVEAMRSCVESNAPRTSSVQTLVMRVQDAEGLVSEARAKVYWRRFQDGHRRILARMEAPEELAHAAVLVIAPPDQLQGILGQSGIQLEEVERVLDLARRPGLRLLAESSDLAGRRVWVVEARSEGNGSSPPERLVGFVDHEYCLPLRVEFYGQNGQPRKVLRADPARVTREAESWVPRSLVIEDLVEGSQSTFRVDSIEVDVPIAPGLLTVKALPGARR